MEYIYFFLNPKKDSELCMKQIYALIQKMIFQVVQHQIVIKSNPYVHVIDEVFNEIVISHLLSSQIE